MCEIRKLQNKVYDLNCFKINLKIINATNIVILCQNYL